MSYPPGMGANAYPTSNPGPQKVQGFSEQQEGFKNAFLTRFNALVTPALRDQYELVAKNAGLQINPDSGLTALVLTAQTQISWTSTAHPGVPTSLDSATPQQTSLEIRAENPVFIRKVTATVNTCVFLPNAISGFAGPPPAAPFEPQVLTNLVMDPADYIYIQVRRPGMGQVYQDNYVSLKQFCGTGSEPYFWSPIPVLNRGGQLKIDVTILPPGQQAAGMVPPFIDRVGFLQLAFHCERFEPFGT